MVKLVRFLNALHVLVLCGVLLSAYSVQFLLKEQPCPLCMLQRLAMIAVGISLLCNLRFGVRALHYGVGLLGCLLGASISLRQRALHICPQFPTFGEPLLGLDLYWWAFIVFSCSIFVIAVDLFLYRKEQEIKKKMNWFEWGVFALLLLVALGNVVTTLSECGFTPCAG